MRTQTQVAQALSSPTPRLRRPTAAMFAAKKIVKEKDAAPDAFELDVAQALCDLEANSNDLKAELRELYIVKAQEVDVVGRKAVVIFVPYKLLKIVHKIQSRLVREVRQPHPAERRPAARRCGGCGGPPPAAAESAEVRSAPRPPPATSRRAAGAPPPGRTPHFLTRDVGAALSPSSPALAHL